jgi:hypothetical protein
MDDQRIRLLNILLSLNLGLHVSKSASTRFTFRCSGRFSRQWEERQGLRVQDSKGPHLDGLHAPQLDMSSWPRSLGDNICIFVLGINEWCSRTMRFSFKGRLGSSSSRDSPPRGKAATPFYDITCQLGLIDALPSASSILPPLASLQSLV